MTHLPAVWAHPRRSQGKRNFDAAAEVSTIHLPPAAAISLQTYYRTGYLTAFEDPFKYKLLKPGFHALPKQRPRQRTVCLWFTCECDLKEQSCEIRGKTGEAGKKTNTRTQHSVG